MAKVNKKVESSNVIQPSAEISRIKDKIYFIRNQFVILDKDLASLYQVETKILNQAVKRNLKRFPSDFMFKLSVEEAQILRSQFVTSRWGGTRYQPYAFTEQGLAMLSGLLNSDIAIQVNINIMRAFVLMRKSASLLSEVNFKVDTLTAKLEYLNRYVEDILHCQNDINEMQEQTNQDVSMQLELISSSLADLQALCEEEAKEKSTSHPIGYRIRMPE